MERLLFNVTGSDVDFVLVRCLSRKNKVMKRHR